MTRINCIPVEQLSGPHLVAEYRELPRVFALAQKAAARGAFSQPKTYVLGRGHLLFFYTRLGYLARRHMALIEEMKKRGYKPTFSGVRREDFPGTPDTYWNDWKPTAAAMRVNRLRIKERTTEMQKIR
ncbi:MAG TPA: pyrimidine dimer DNA glycosylase/endonuclease V [Castellaniella sp.]|uniref:pyrimidine dimer DNA glycosylase/endonuclease V n=1 Tax=Castellaniella sp. TaxID=1955812 RepID=UPI002EE47954